MSGAGADDPAVAGTTIDLFEAALEVEVEMQPLAEILSSTDIKEIIAYLNPPAPAPASASANSISAQAKGEASISSATSAARPMAHASTGGLDWILLMVAGSWGVFARMRRAQSNNR